MAATAPALSLRDLGMTYRRGDTSVEALAGLDLDVADQEFIAIVGPSGCGKSTLLKLVTGLRPPTRGDITLHGKPVTGPRSDVGIVFQTPVLFPWRTVLDNVLLPADVLRLPRAEYRDKAMVLLDLVGLGGFERSYPQELSGGMQQRAASRKTVLFITHSIAEAVFLADRIVVMSPRPGRIIDILRNPMPRLRSMEDTLNPEFGRMVHHVRGLLGGHAGAAL
jgi:NitT/TauT family transport system ATP-binding protein